VASVELPLLNGRRFDERFPHGLRAAPTVATLQVNIGYVCNLACRHCHVESSPARSGPGENMDEATARRVVEWALAQASIRTVDITGGSPEMNHNFRWMIEAFHAAGLHVMDRCNPTIIGHVEPGSGRTWEWLPRFLADHRVEVVASLPCYLEENVEHQRGRGSFEASIDGLRRLNREGYGIEPHLPLNLVYNPNGPHLPPPQERLEADYRRHLSDGHGISFTRLWTITNMPIKRWRHELERRGALGAYMDLLAGAFNPGVVEGLMCRHLISIDPHGRMYDCDFNQALGLGARGAEGRRIWDVTAAELGERLIATGEHCYGCTAGAGSSCGGVLV
jgi:radical SAM/Cys-rich protein